MEKENPVVVVKESDPAIVVYGKIVNSLEYDALKEFIKDVYKIYSREKQAVIQAGKKYIDVVIEN